MSLTEHRGLDEGQVGGGSGRPGPETSGEAGEKPPCIVQPPNLPGQKYVHPLLPLSLQVRAQSHQLPVKEVTLQQAQLYIDTVIGSLPKDLQAVLCPP